MTHHELDEPSNEELRVISRRSALRLLSGAGLALVAGCGVDSSTSTIGSGSASTPAGSASTQATPVTSTAPSSTFGGAGSCVLIPQETEGPFPLDLSGDEAFFRTDITEGRPGVPMTLALALVDVNAGCRPISGARVDVWHCDADGSYSGFAQRGGADTSGETFCRGIQLSDAGGQVTFQTIFPGWYPGRITHVHFQVFFDSGLASTSQIAFPAEVVEAVYAVDPYAAKGRNTTVRTLSEDNIFADGSQFQLASITGGADTRIMATLLVGVSV
jgi:protocatechuate 3,4-dioxygenase beta subunit